MANLITINGLAKNGASVTVTYPAAPPPSIPDTVDLTVVAPGGVVHLGGKSFGINATAVITIDGTPDTSSSDVRLLMPKAGQLYQQNGGGGTWTEPLAGGPGTPVTDPAIIAGFHPTLPGPPIVIVPPPKPTTGVGFEDVFSGVDPSRWVPDQSNGAPLPLAGAKGNFSRHYYTGWLTNGTGPGGNGNGDISSYCLQGNHEDQCYTPNSVVIAADGSGAQLIARKGVPNIGNKGWVSGVLTQNWDKAQCKGYFEWVVALPTGHGFWPACWMMPAPKSRQPDWSYEFDPLEKIGMDGSNNKSDLFYHAGLNWNNNSASAGLWVPVPDLTRGHKIGMLWDDRFVTHFFDGVAVMQTPTPDTAQSVPAYMICNLAVGGQGSWPGQPDDGVTRAVMKVAAMRSYALGSWGPSTIPTTPPVPPGLSTT